ncbi:MAG: MraY family glycosyltransferase [Coriobacteriia bacterium]|nr:MraY family glycosyltransferase [Coriobacteriia bacterium]
MLEQYLTPEIVQAVIVFSVAFLVTLIMVPPSRWLAATIGAIDYPSNRRVNDHPVPRCGGIALYLGFLAGCLTLYLGVAHFGWRVTDLYIVKGIQYPSLLMGISIMFIVGLIDDIVQITPKQKLAGQLLAATIVALSGVSIDMVRSLVDGAYLELGWLNVPLTVAYLVVFVNIINLIDGLDGLAAGIVAIVSTAMLVLVTMRGSMTLALICVAIIAICLAFLCYNFYPASTFMGDSGALLLGLLIGTVSLAGIVRTQSLVINLVPLVIAGIPVLDTVSAFIRRTRQGQRFDQADKGHIHHRLLNAGFGQRKAVVILYACTAALAVVGLLISSVSGPVRWIVFGVLFAVVFIVIWRVGLFKPVLQHHFDNRGNVGPRVPKSREEKNGAHASPSAEAADLAPAEGGA